MIKMETLDPELFLTLLQAIDTKENLNLKMISVGDIDGDNVLISVSIANTYRYYCWIYKNSTDAIGAFHFMHDSPSALDMAREIVADTLQDFYENVFIDYVKDDTGHDIAESFTALITTEIDRINALFV
jgi:hypothetical protein